MAGLRVLTKRAAALFIINFCGKSFNEEMIESKKEALVASSPETKNLVKMADIVEQKHKKIIQPYSQWVTGLFL